MFRESIRALKRATIRTAVRATVVVGVVEITTRLPSQGRSSKCYHYLCDEIVTPCLRQRLVGPEVAHQIAITMTKRGLSPQHHPSALEQRVSVESTVFGKKFDNPIGLAAGFDKDGEVIEGMLRLGFGFVEIGTVTPQPQPGNPAPRMFRLSEDFGIINRYGFNSKGADQAEENLKLFREGPSTSKGDEDDEEPSSINKVLETLQWIWYKLYPTVPVTGLVGVNIGKNKGSEDAIADYVYNIKKLGQYADFMVINVSSPNTAGLRDLQKAASLRALLTECMQARKDLKVPVPLLVKLAPDLTDDDLKSIAKTCLDVGIDGIVVTNTTNQRPDDLLSIHSSEIGGLSGAPIRDTSTECIRKMYEFTDGKIPIIGVGGVGSGKDAYEKLKAGASLVEVYSMMVYRGPGLVSRIRHELADLMVQSGKRSIEDVVGMDHEDIAWRRREEKAVLRRRMESRSAVLKPLQQ